MRKQTPATLIVDEAGVIVASSGLPPSAARSARGRPCHDVVTGLPGAAELPCHPGCTRRLMSCRPAETSVKPVRMDDKPWQLACVQAGPFVVVVLTPRANESPEAWEHITERERQVLDLVAAGKTTAEIAEMLGIRPATVRTHVEHMRVRMCVSTRAELVARCYRVGLLD